MSRLYIPALVAGVAVAALLVVAPRAAALELTPCRLVDPSGQQAVRGECGRLSVPLDRATPQGPALSLAVARIPALSRTPRNVALTVIAGGPGQSSLEFFAAYFPAFRRVREEFDVILVDQRGTGDSHRLACSTPEQTLGDIWSVQQTTGHARDCLRKLGADPRFFTTSVAVADLDAVREAFGYRQLSVYGVSYGTRVAQHYLRRYPAQTHSVILDGVVPVDEALGPDIAIQAQHAMDAAFARCRETPACAQAFPDLATHFAQLLTQLRARPAVVELRDPLDAQPLEVTLSHLDLAGAIRLLSYSPQSVALLPLLIDQAARGNLVPITAQALSLTRSMVDAMAYGMHNAVVCTEDMPFVQGVDEDALAATFMGDVVLEGLQAVCEIWPRGVIDDDFRLPFASEVPVLVLSGEADPITPPAYGARVSAYLGNARHLIGRGQGHGLAPVGCVPRLMGEFVRARDPDALDASCLDLQGPEPFFTSFAGPQP